MSGNILLIGMPGSGKSTIGVLLAKTLGKRFLDMDLLLQEKEGLLLQQIIDQKGLDYFLRLEEQTALNLKLNNHVLAPGGSMVYGAKAMDRLKQECAAIYLQLPFSEIEARINNIRTRGIAIKEGQSLRALYAERAPLYQQYADLTIECSGQSLEETISEIIMRLPN